MEFREERWFVRFRGQTLGPLTSDQVRAALRKNELSRDDKISSSREPNWITISAHPEWSRIAVGGLSALRPMPPPQKLLQKKRAPLPKAPAPVIDITPIEADTHEASPRQEMPKLRAPERPAEVAEAGVAIKVEPATQTSAKPARKNRALQKVRKKAKNSNAASSGANRTAEQTLSGSAPPLALTADPRPRELPAPSSDTTHLPALNDDPSWRLLEAANPPRVEPPAAAVSAGPIGREAHSLMESLRAWENEERDVSPLRSATKPKSSPLPSPPLSAPLDDMPERPVFHFPREEPTARSSASTVTSESAASVRRIELHFSASKQFLVIFGGAMAILLAAAIYFFAFAHKTRGPADSRLPDPSSPTIQPSEPGDPTPALKAPTRPRRD